jgi:hypothetical protein
MIIFSGCAPKIQYITQKCETPLPEKLYDGVKCGKQGKALSGQAFLVCMSDADINQKADYSNLKNAFESCK